MKRSNHNSAESARAELVRAGYWPTHSKPGEPQLWKRPKHAKTYYIARESRPRSDKWHIVCPERYSKALIASLRNE